jgi:hypothetical protein
MEPKAAVFKTTTVAAVLKCPYDCVKTALQSSCFAHTIISSLTDCSPQETCCQRQPIQQCVDDYECTLKELLMVKCDVRLTLADPEIVARPCPGGLVCCARKKASCPPTHACVPSVLATLCEPGSAILGLCADDKVCCQLIVPSSTTAVPVATSTTTTVSSKPTCEGFGRCLAPYLLAECKRVGSGSFSPDFACPSPRLQCCVPLPHAFNSTAEKALTLG